MPEQCPACGQEADIKFVKRIKETRTDSAIYQCSKCQSFTSRGNINEKNMRMLTLPQGMLWHIDEERQRFICEYNNLHLVFPVDKRWTCDKCWRQCQYTPHLSKGTLVFRRRPDGAPAAPAAPSA